MAHVNIQPGEKVTVAIKGLDLYEVVCHSIDGDYVDVLVRCLTNQRSIIADSFTLSKEFERRTGLQL